MPRASLMRWASSRRALPAPRPSESGWRKRSWRSSGRHRRVDEKKDFQETRKDIPNIASMDQAEAAALIAENPAYGTIICRCEKVTEGEIIDAIRRPLGARSLDGIKRRTRAGMGRCQAGFCSTKVMDILARELGIPLGGSHESRRRVQDADRR